MDVQEAEKDVSSPLKTVEEEKAAEVIDPLGELLEQFPIQPFNVAVCLEQYIVSVNA
ncbi:hypothetical protein JHK87_051755 [Glycine soja]|nr:hypothetical protein JHK87_051755 [Glycine soja]